MHRNWGIKTYYPGNIYISQLEERLAKLDTMGLTDNNFYIYAFIFRLYLSNLIESNRKHSQSYVE